MYYNVKNYKQRVFIVCIAIISFSMLCSSCRKQQQATIYFNSSYTSKLDELMQEEKYQEVLELLSKRLAEIPEDSQEAARINVFIGDIYASYIHDRNKAIYYISKSIKINQKSHNQSDLADSYYVMSNVYVEMGGDVEEGIKYAEKAENLYEKSVGSISIEVADSLSNKGSLYYRSERWEEALESLEEAEDIYESFQRATGYISIKIGKTLIQLNENEKAEETFQKALKLGEIQGNRYYMAIAEQYLGWLSSENEEYDKSTDMYNKALDFFETDKRYLSDAAFVYNNLAYNAVKVSGNWEDGFPYAIKACQAMEKIDLLTEEDKMYKEDYKYKIRQYYNKWKAEAGDADFDMWDRKSVV